MKRAGILLLALVALVVALRRSGTGRPAGEVKAVDQSKAAVTKYWTAERMRNATPLDVVDGVAGAKQKRARHTRSPATSRRRTTPPTGRSSSPTAPPTTSAPAPRSPAATRASSGPRATASTRARARFYTNWAFVPGYKDGAAPYGTWTARQLLTTAAWGQAGDFSYDLGAAVVNANGGATLTDTVGSRGAGFNQAAEQHYLSHGYPAAPPFSGGRMFICESDLGIRDTSADPATMGIGCDMTGGSSGGGWVVGNSVLSVNSYGYSNQPNVMYGPYQGTVAQQLYTSAGSS